MVHCIYHVCVRVRQIMEVNWLYLRVKTHQPSYDSIFLWPLFTSMPLTAVVNKLTVLSVLCVSAFSSVTAEKWVPIIEVPVNSVKHFLEKKKRDGFSILGLEQTTNSVPLDHYAFPKKTVSILNHSSQFLQHSVGAWKEFFINYHEKKKNRMVYHVWAKKYWQEENSHCMALRRKKMTHHSIYLWQTVCQLIVENFQNVSFTVMKSRDVCLFYQFARYWSLDVKRRAYRWT